MKTEIEVAKEWLNGFEQKERIAIIDKHFNKGNEIPRENPWLAYDSQYLHIFRKEVINPWILRNTTSIFVNSNENIHEKHFEIYSKEVLRNQSESVGMTINTNIDENGNYLGQEIIYENQSPMEEENIEPWVTHIEYLQSRVKYLETLLIDNEIEFESK